MVRAVRAEKWPPARSTWLQKLGLPLVVMGYGYDRPWRVRRAWDQFAIPRPFSRARAVPSHEIFIPRTWIAMESNIFAKKSNNS